MYQTISYRGCSTIRHTDTIIQTDRHRHRQTDRIYFISSWKKVRLSLTMTLLCKKKVKTFILNESFSNPSLWKQVRCHILDRVAATRATPSQNPLIIRCLHRVFPKSGTRHLRLSRYASVSALLFQLSLVTGPLFNILVCRVGYPTISSYSYNYLFQTSSKRI